MQAIIKFIPVTGDARACGVLGTTRGELRRQRLCALHRAIMGPPVPRPPGVSPTALSEADRQLVLDTLSSERFVDTAPACVHAVLLDEGCYLGSVRTIYRLLKVNSGCAERQNSAGTPQTPNLNCWPPVLIKFGRSVFSKNQGCWPSGVTSIFT